MKFGKGVVNAVFGLIVLGIALMIAPYILDKVQTSMPAPTGAGNLAAQGNASSNTTVGLTMANIAPILSGVGILLAVLGTFLAVTRRGG